MGNSTITLQSVVDFARTIGKLAPVLSVAGFSSEPALTIANDVMQQIVSQRFNWKWNRMAVTPFLTNSWQQDYCSIGLANVGWLEHCAWVDINNTQLPKPIGWMQCVRDLERSSIPFSVPTKICWLPNDQLIQDVWPGAQKPISNPLGAISQPANPILNILDANRNILVLTTFGTTGNSAPAAAAASAPGVTVADGSCVWTVADPKAAGFRIAPPPPQSGRVYQICPIAQAKAPANFTSLDQVIDPIPDDYSHYFREGFITFLHRHSGDPQISAQFAQKLLIWQGTLAEARGQGDRERDDAAFVPDRNIMAEPVLMPRGPAWPFPY